VDFILEGDVEVVEVLVKESSRLNGLEDGEVDNKEGSVWWLGLEGDS